MPNSPTPTPPSSTPRIISPAAFPAFTKCSVARACSTARGASIRTSNSAQVRLKRSIASAAPIHILGTVPPCPKADRLLHCVAMRALLLFFLLFGVSSRAADWLLVQPQQVQREAISTWKDDGFSGVVLLLDETNATSISRAATTLSAAAIPFQYWIEVGRNTAFANAHPQWMASLGMHNDWRKNFAKPPRAGNGEVVKAFPWVPINYREAFDAHVERVAQLLRNAPTNHSGLLLNHLQAGPSSCGCGNLQCRWATDYQVPATGTRAGDDAAAQFVRAVQRSVGSRPVLPVWTTECEHEDLPASKRAGRPTTGLCGTVGCSI